MHAHKTELKSNLNRKWYAPHMAMFSLDGSFTLPSISGNPVCPLSANSVELLLSPHLLNPLLCVCTSGLDVWEHIPLHCFLTVSCVSLGCKLFPNSLMTMTIVMTLTLFQGLKQCCASQRHSTRARWMTNNKWVNWSLISTNSLDPGPQRHYFLSWPSWGIGSTCTWTISCVLSLKLTLAPWRVGRKVAILKYSFYSSLL